jgi:hypothetical protein
MPCARRSRRSATLMSTAGSSTCPRDLRDAAAHAEAGRTAEPALPAPGPRRPIDARRGQVNAAARAAAGLTAARLYAGRSAGSHSAPAKADAIAAPMLAGRAGARNCGRQAPPERAARSRRRRYTPPA